MDLVILESPYAGTPEEIERNERFARACMRDCLKNHGEAPYASHLLYTQPGVLADGDKEERALGIGAGLEWGKRAARTVVYVNFGISPGMQKGIERALSEGREVVYRQLGSWTA